MRYFVTLALAVVAVTASAQEPSTRNPFSPSAQPKSQKSATPQPNLVLPPQIPAPPGNLKLPPVVPLKQLPAAAPSKLPSSGPVEPSVPASGPSEQEAPTAPDVFLSRDEIARSRASCKADLVGPTALSVSAAAAVARIKFNNSSGRSCFVGLQSDKPWASLSSAGPQTVEVAVQPNNTTKPRSSRLVIVTTNDRWTVLLSQAAGQKDQELDEIELEEVEP